MRDPNEQTEAALIVGLCLILTPLLILVLLLMGY
jgi:hypothetical protein|tara:strand:+ start:451 stop:552 length:102 start_codon:yes stop_codon:yes gene_type:complete